MGEDDATNVSIKRLAPKDKDPQTGAAFEPQRIR